MPIRLDNANLNAALENHFSYLMSKFKMDLQQVLYIHPLTYIILENVWLST